MSINLNAEVSYSGQGCKRIQFSDLRDCFREIVEKAKDDGVEIGSFKHIVKHMPALGQLALNRVVDKFSHYFEQWDRDGSATIDVFMKEIASMDPELERRIVRKSIEMLNSFAGMSDMQHVAVGKNQDGSYVVKVAYLTDIDADAPYTVYDEEKSLRTTMSEAFRDKQPALVLSLWLAGALNVRHIDEDEMP